MRVLDRASRGVVARVCGSVVAGLLAVVLVAAGVMFGLPALGFSVWSVSGTSMEPTFSDGSVLVLRSSSDSVVRGDVVVIDRPVLAYPRMAHSFEEVMQFVDSIMES